MIWLLIATYVIILVLELPSLLKKEGHRELWAFVVFFAIGLYMSLAFYYNWPLSEPFEALVSAIGTS